MKKSFTILFSLIYLVTYAQKEDYAWFIDINQNDVAPVQGLLFDWNLKNTDPIAINLPLGIDNNNASICDKDGNLLFWSNGCAVINREQEVMPHGDTLNWDAFREVIGWKECLRGYPGAQNIKILPDPADENGFYIFHKARRYFGQFEDITTDLRFSYVDMALDGGKGDVVFFDSILYNNPVTNANLEAIYTDNGNNWWLLQPVEDDSLILTYLIDDKGIERFPDQNSHLFFKDKRAGAGTMRISPDGSKLAYYDYFLNLHVYDFDRMTGLISNHQKVTLFDDAEEMPNNKFRFSSVEWSPNSRFMYAAVSDSLFQIDSWEADMDNGIRLIDVYNGTLDPFSTRFYIATLAPDCKIYICSTNGSRSYHIIHRPDELGTACNFVQNGLKLPQSSGIANLPLFPRFRVDEADKCDPTITSVFGDVVYYRRDLEVYPSPTAGPITIELPEQWRDGVLLVYDINGQVAMEKNINRGENTIHMDLSFLVSGNYNVELYPSDNRQRIFYGKQILVAK